MSKLLVHSHASDADGCRVRVTPESVPTGWSGSRITMPISLSSLRTIDFAWAASSHSTGPKRFRGSAPRKKLRQTDISGTMARSW